MFTEQEKQKIQILEQRVKKGNLLMTLGIIAFGAAFVSVNTLPAAITGTSAFVLAIVSTIISSVASIGIGALTKQIAILNHKNLLRKSFYRDLSEMNKNFNNSITFELKNKVFNIQNTIKTLSLDFNSICKNIHDLEKLVKKYPENKEISEKYENMLLLGQEQWKVINTEYTNMDNIIAQMDDIISKRLELLNNFDADMYTTTTNTSLRRAENSFLKKLESKFNQLKSNFLNKLQLSLADHKDVEKFKLIDNTYKQTYAMYNKYYNKNTIQFSKSKQKSKSADLSEPLNKITLSSNTEPVKKTTPPSKNTNNDKSLTK